MTDNYRDGDILKEVLAHNNNSTYKQKIKVMDKSEMIRHEIERRKDHNLEIGNPLFEAMAEEDIEILSFINSMQEEPVNEDLAKAAQIYAASLVLNGAVSDLTVKQLREVADKCFKAGAQWQRQITNQDILSTLDRIRDKQISSDENDIDIDCIISEDFANKIKSDYVDYKRKNPDCTELTIDVFADIACHFVNWREQQMMKDAISGYVAAYPYIDGIEVMFCGKHKDVIGKYKVGSRVKLIIMQEEQS